MAVLGGIGAQQEGDGVERKMGKHEESWGFASTPRPCRG
jgi:hypothetical protein